MSVKKDASGRRSIAVEVEVPGTPEQVWEAIATGPGVSSWFVPTEVAQGEDGAMVVTSRFAPGMEGVATVTAWEPPRRFAAESRNFPQAPPMATEWIVEARSGGTCLVRVVHSLFASSDDWDGQLESIESGWPSFFSILRLYLAHFRGQRSASFEAMAVAPGPESEAWQALTGSLGLPGAPVGGRWRGGAGTPPVAGRVEASGDGAHGHHELILLEEPAPGIAFFSAFGMGAQAYLTVRFYFYGAGAPAAASSEEPRWQSWMKELFPAVVEAPANPCGE